jgi:DNA-binding HxlR family transcriptional regulator
MTESLRRGRAHYVGHAMPGTEPSWSAPIERSRLHGDLAGAGARAALEDALAVVGDRWALPIVVALAAGPARFKELAEAVAPIAPNILSARLRQLEVAGVLLARPYSRRPVRMLYELTPTGAELVPVAGGLAAWAARRAGRPAPFVHATCGGVLGVSWFCATCGEAVADPGAERDEIV